MRGVGRKKKRQIGKKETAICIINSKKLRSKREKDYNKQISKCKIWLPGST